ncbi:tripartite tricarboxylate transporter TctB family protein [Streptomonospora sp. S1-112]|uniref:Tripartite tricarboxylate transporter TctB family protein n=1 Tax=Streptomonospora mangrovi TaxID=2883123 RepID=A0A9X3NJ76_9ACTN|nr:tripartite tricarboxylate transporter TctB family protein [Streptomonospora mangrovi]MDA0564452.1 tripartite tricarboxylate transporter TctB family protein [Streptomonospora mangrovi]
MTTAEPRPTGAPEAAPEAAPAATAAPEAAPAPARAGGRRAALAVPALTAAITVCCLAGGALMEVPAAAGFLGPRFFPLAVGALLLATALASAAWALRPGARAAAPDAPPAPPASEGGPAAAPDGAAPAHDGPSAADATAPAGGNAAPGAAPVRSDWRALGTMAATFTAHLLLLEPLGWLVAGTLLFWGTSFALDRRRPLLDLCVAAALSGTVQLLFSGLLDVPLPAGLLGKVL